MNITRLKVLCNIGKSDRNWVKTLSESMMVLESSAGILCEGPILSFADAQNRLLGPVEVDETTLRGTLRVPEGLPEPRVMVMLLNDQEEVVKTLKKWSVVRTSGWLRKGDRS